MTSGGKGPSAIRVAEFGGSVSGGFAGRLLRLMGADVIQIEMVSGTEGVPNDRFGADPGPGGMAGVRSAYLAEGKRRIDVDVAHPDGRAVLAKVAAWADCAIVFSDDTRPVVPRELEIDAGPGVIVLLSPWGGHSRRQGQQAMSTTLFAMSGESSMLPGGLGYDLFPEGPPLVPRGKIAEKDGGVIAALTCLAACYRGDRVQRDRVVIEVALREAEVSLNRWLLSHYTRSGWVEDRSTRAYAYAGLTRCADGYVMFQPTTDAHWTGLVAMMDNPSWALGEQFSTYEGRAANGSQISEELQRWAAGKDKAALVDLGLRHGVPVGAFRGPAELLACEQLAARHFLHPYGTGQIPMFAAPQPAAAGVEDPRDDCAGALQQIGFSYAEARHLIDSAAVRLPLPSAKH